MEMGKDISGKGLTYILLSLEISLKVCLRGPVELVAKRAMLSGFRFAVIPTPIQKLFLHHQLGSGMSFILSVTYKIHHHFLVRKRILLLIIQLGVLA